MSNTEAKNCPGCDGAGTVRAVTYGHGPDDYEYDAECTACGGTGSADLADAINALPYQQHTVKPHTAMVSRAAVLEIIKARAALAAQPLTDERILRIAKTIPALETCEAEWLNFAHRVLFAAGAAPVAQQAETQHILRLADDIDPFTRKRAPDHLTAAVAAKVMRELAHLAAVHPQQPAPMKRRDWCTDPDNCSRCKAPQWDQHNHSHAGIPLSGTATTAHTTDPISNPQR
jgi:hypothetical protein